MLKNQDFSIKNQKKCYQLLRVWLKYRIFASTNQYGQKTFKANNYESTRDRLLNRCSEMSVCSTLIKTNSKQPVLTMKDVSHSFASFDLLV